jgi:hypothetical protein
MEPSNVERTGTDRTPDPGSSALRAPTTAEAGSPAAAAALATADEPRPARLSRWRTDRTVSTARSPNRTAQRTDAPAPRTSTSALIPRLGSKRRTGPTGASGDTATAPFLLPDEVPAEAPFGHAAADYAVGLAQRARARRVMLVHHKPDRTDDALDMLADRFSANPCVTVATEGEIIDH